MISRGVATFGLDSGRCPRWLFQRMVSLGQKIVCAVVQEYGPEEFVRRIADPVWFQSLGTVLAFDWNASGLTTILTAALKEAIHGQEKELGIFICGGKGKTSRRTPDEISDWAEVLSLPPGQREGLIYNSRMTAKVDSALVQDGFQIYHHSFFFTLKGCWAVVQQGMNIPTQTARRYHWHSDNIKDLICQPHTGIVSQISLPTLDLTSRKSQKNRQLSLELVQGSFSSLWKDVQILSRHYCATSQSISLRFQKEKLTFLNLSRNDFTWHPVLQEDFSNSVYLKKILARLCQIRPADYENLVFQEGVGPKTLRALSLVSEVIYGAKPSYEDPARYAFAFGGKDHIPYPVERRIYDETIDFFQKVIAKARLPFTEKNKILSRLKT